MVLFSFLNFFVIFLQFSIARQVGTERNETIIFILFLSHPPSTYGGLKMSHNGIFLIFFEFFCFVFEIFNYALGRNETDRQ